MEREAAPLLTEPILEPASSRNSSDSAFSHGRKGFWSRILTHRATTDPPRDSNISLSSGTAASKHKSVALQLILAPRLRFARAIVAFIAFIYVFVLSALLSVGASLAQYSGLGSCFGIFGSTVILVSSIVNPDSRRHPNTLLLWRTALNLILSVCILINPTFFREPHDSVCVILSFVMEVCEIASEAWVLCVVIDLWRTLSNPFISYSRSMTFVYHPFVWSFSICAGVVMLLTKSNGRFMSDTELQWCWLRQGPVSDLFHFSTSTWTLFHGPLLLNYSACIFVLIRTASRLRNGLSVTLESRLLVLVNNTINLLGCLVLTIAIATTYAIHFASNSDRATSCMLFLMASKGLWDLEIWIIVNEMGPSTASLQPQANAALVHELLHFVTLGIQCSLSNPAQPVLELPRANKKVHVMEFLAHLLLGRGRPSSQNIYGATGTASQSGLDDAIAGTSGHNNQQHPTEAGAITDEIHARVTWETETDEEVRLSPGHAWITQRNPNDVVRIRVHCGESFERVRRVFGVDNEALRTTLSHPIKERISDGGSNSLFFFSSDQRYIVKSLTRGEVQFWFSKRSGILETDRRQTMAEWYADHVTAYPNTFLCRILGVYSLDIYGVRFNFKIMENLFHDASCPVHEVYDIKGSWVQRQGRTPESGETVVCRHCNQKFNYGVKIPCLYSKYHQPRIVYKDNDLKYRVCLPNIKEVIQQLDIDAEFLAETFRTMDYSLLLGVHYESKPTSQPTASAPASSSVPTDQSLLTANQPPQLLAVGPLEGTAKAGDTSVPVRFTLGIIDLQQTWTVKKRLERWFKMLWYDGRGLSTVNPSRYKRRFQKAVRQVTNFPDREMCL